MTETLGQLHRTMADIFRPPERLTVAEAADKYHVVSNPPAYVGPYITDETPYMREPMEMSQSRDHTSLVFVGPSQSGKTEAVVIAVLAYTIKCNPMDAMVFLPSQAASRDFSKRRIDRMHRHSRAIGAEVLKGQNSDNTHDKMYRSGMLLSVSWPSINEMSSKPVPLVIFTEYDRMEDDVGGEGSPFLLGQKRTTRFANMAMTIVDSSPGRDIEQEQEHDDEGERRERGAHEAPPCKGVLGLYNNSDRRRWNWPCIECSEYFEPDFAKLHWITTKEVDGKRVPTTRKETLDSVRMACPHCGSLIPHEAKRDMNLRGRWVAEGQTVTKDGVVEGAAIETKMLGYWLKGPAARYITWRDMVAKWLDAEDNYQRTNSQEDLKTTTNTDQGEPYESRGAGSVRLAQDLEDRALRDVEMRTVPLDTRALIATIDSQANRWEVQVHAILPGEPYNTFVLDRFKIEKSKRVDAEGDTLWVKPASYPEDWDLITEQVLDKAYPLVTGDGEMRIAYTFCDSGGGKGRSHDKKTVLDADMSVTSNAYNYWRRLKMEGRAGEFFLVKGDSNAMSPRAHLEFPDSERKDRNAGARGEVPVLFLNVNSLKDTLNSRLSRTEGTGGLISYPHWLPRWWFEELVSEQRSRKGWVKVGSRRNEAWDLLTYFLGACIWRRVEATDWERPPPWLAPWGESVHITYFGENQAPVDKRQSLEDRFASLASELA